LLKPGGGSSTDDAPRVRVEESPKKSWRRG